MPETTTLTTRERQAAAYQMRTEGTAFRVIAETLGWDRPQQAHAAVRAHANRIGDTSLIQTRTTVTAVQAMFLSGGTFGVELEIVGISQDQAADALHVVLGYRPRVTGYHGDSSYSQWTSQSDCSLRSHNRLSAELVSPVLSGQSGFDELKTVMDALAAAGASVNVSCGTHVHHGVDHLTFDQMSLFVENLYAAQPALTALVSRSRRRGQYPGSALTERQVNRVKSLGTYYSNGDAWKSRLTYEANNGNRYTRFNFTKFTRTGTVEFRQHQGTLDFEKLSAWIRLAQAIVEASVRGITLTRGTVAPLRQLRNAGLLTSADLTYFAARRSALR